MSTLDSWSLEDSWDSWDSWAMQGGGPAPTTLLPQALASTREMLVFAADPDAPVKRPANWPGTAVDSNLHSLSASVRSQVIVTELLQAVRIAAVGGDIELTWGQTKNQRVHRPDKDTFVQQLARVEAFAELRAERLPEILSQLDYSPTFWAEVLPLNTRETPYTLELMATSVMFASFVIQRVKAFFNLPRPPQLSPRIQPIIPIPPYSTFPSGHATESALVAHLLIGVVFANRKDPSPEFKAWHSRTAAMYKQLATRIAENRVVAGIHFPVDADGGHQLAEGLLGVLQSESRGRTPGLASFKWLFDRARTEWGDQ